MTSRARRVAAVLAAATTLLVAGCGTIRTTTTARGAQEMLLVSTAAQRAIRRLDLSALAGRKVFVDAAPIQAVDRLYVVDALQQAVTQAGAIHAAKAEDAEVVLEARLAALGTTEKDFQIILPLPPLPVALTEKADGAPDSIGFTYDIQRGWAQLRCFALERESGAMIGRWQARWGGGYASTFSDDVWPQEELLDKLERDYAQ